MIFSQQRRRLVDVEPLRVVEYGLGERLVPYDEAWDEQRRLQTAVAEGTEPDTLLLLEHEPVYTAGSGPRHGSGRSTARPSSTSTAAARSPGTARASSSATRSCACPRPTTSSATSGGSRPG